MTEQDNFVRRPGSHRDLIVWQKGMDLTVLVYDLSRLMPRNEQYGLASQVQRAAVSIVANIAAGNGRGSCKDYARFISIARGSAVELDTLLTVAMRVGVLDQPAIRPAAELTDEICRMLFALHARLTVPGLPELETRA